MLQQEIINALVTAGGTILLALIGWVSKRITAWIKSDEFGKELGNFAYLADMAVMFAEQIAKHDETVNKFEEAQDALIKMANDKGIKITDDMVKTFIEAAVKRMNDAGLENKKEPLPERTQDPLPKQ